MATLYKVQRGSKTMASGNATLTITQGVDPGFDEAVDQSKTLLFVTVRTTALTFNRIVTCRWSLNEAGDTITVTRSGTGAALDIEWELWTFSVGVVAQYVETVQISPITSTTMSISASSLDGGRWIIPSGNSIGSDLIYNRGSARWLFDDETTVRATRDFSTSTPTYNAIVVELDTATVQSASIGAFTLTASQYDIPISAIDISNSVVWGSYSSITSGTGLTMGLQSQLTSPTNIRLHRGATDSKNFTIQVYIVTFNDPAIRVQHFVSTHLSGSGIVDTPVSKKQLQLTGTKLNGIYNNPYLGVVVQSTNQPTIGTVSLIESRSVRTTMGIPSASTSTFYGSVIQFNLPLTDKAFMGSTGQNPFTLTQSPVGNYIELLPL